MGPLPRAEGGEHEIFRDEDANVRDHFGGCAGRSCRHDLPPNPSTGTTVNSNVVVPANTECSLLGLTVTGNLQVGTGAVAFSGSTTVGGNISVGSGAYLAFRGLFFLFPAPLPSLATQSSTATSRPINAES
jgi:hypothetical protein